MKNKLSAFFATVVAPVREFFTGTRWNFAFYATVIVLVNILSFSGLYVKWDLTREDSFSLSRASRQAVRKLEDKVIVKVFFTENLAAPYNGVERYVKDLVMEYADAGGSKFSYEFVDMSDEKNKERADAYGIYPVQITEMGSDEMKQSNVYMGMVILHGDLIEKINEITDSNGIEYKITGAINKLRSKVDALAGLRSTLKVQVFLTQELEQFGIAGVKDLRKIAEDSFAMVNKENDGKLSFEFVSITDPKQTDEIAARYGIEKQQWPQVRTPDGKTIAAGAGIVGAVVTLGDEFRAVRIPLARTPFGGVALAGLDKLGDSIKNAVDLLLAKTVTVGYVTGHGEVNLNDERRGAAALKELNADFYVFRELDLKTDIPDDIRMLVINGPKQEFSEAELFRIDQYLMKGGSVIFFVDSFNEFQQGGNMFGGSAFMPVNSGLQRLLSAYGFTVNADYVMDKNCFADRSGQKLYFAPWIERENMSHKNIVTKHLKKMLVAKVSSVTPNDAMLKTIGASWQPLMKSSKEGWLMKGQINLTPFMINPPEEKELGQHILAVSAEGRFASAFGGAIPEEIAKDLDPKIAVQESLKQAVTASRIAIIGSSEITMPPFVDADMRNPNSVFMHNLFDWAAKNEKFQEMRSKGMEFNPLDKTSEGFRLGAKIANIAGIPALVVLLALLAYQIRRKRRKAIQKLYAGGADE